jgi:hypothetical protein
VIDAMYARDAATTALAAAETPNAETLTTTGSPTPRKTPRQARADLEEAEDAYRQARRTRDALDELVASKGSTVEFKRELMEAAAAAAVRAHSSAEIDAFVAGTERMQAELHERIAALEWLLRAGIIDKTDVVRRITERFHSPVPEWRLPPVSNIVLRMGAQIAELCRNPKASAKLLS